MKASGKCDIGRRRESNQDTFRLTRPSKNAVLALVCDGMGGANGGEVASSVAAETFLARFGAWLSAQGVEEDGTFDYAPLLGGKGRRDREEGSPVGLAMRAAAAQANFAVLRKAAEEPSLSGMGTTLVAAFIADGVLTAVNVGDSRLYVCSGGELRRVTRDHSYVQFLLDRGDITPEEAAISPYRNVITRAIGLENDLECDLLAMPVPDGETAMLLCSDGLYNFVPEETLTACLAKTASGESEPDEAAQKLVRTANEGGGGDNITAVILADLTA